MLDERLSLAAALYEPCALGADIGTDHGFLPCHLLEQHICQRMLLADVSPKALARAKAEVQRRGLSGRTELVCADGLAALREPCGCVSMMGLGGETIARLLTEGRQRLQGAVLILSAHTDLPMVRRAVGRIDYHLTREELCRAAGRFYVVWRAEPGAAQQSEAEIAFGSLLFQSRSPLLADYIRWRIAVLTTKLNGLRRAAMEDAAAIAALEDAIRFYQAQLEG